ncbi:MAG: alpha/beta hydrolase [Bacillota bacterium]
MNIEKVNLKSNKEIVMTAYLLDTSGEFHNITSRSAVLIFPGGGYYSTSDREAEPIAMAYLAEGFNAFVLRYSVGKESNFSAALQDGEEAIALIRENAELWNTDKNKIAVVGFSAGGHLAAALGTMGNHRPNALILGYPCILNTLGNVLAFPVPSLEKEVDTLTPPTFLFSTFEDELVPIENTLSFMQALNERNIPFESHIFQKGKHGLSLGKPLSSSGLKSFVDNDFAQWLSLSVSWLHSVLGDFPADKESLIPDVKDVMEYSVNVMLDGLWNHPICRKIVIEYIPAFENADIKEGSKFYSLEMINLHLPQPLSKSDLLELDQRLRAIPFNFKKQTID